KHMKEHRSALRVSLLGEEGQRLRALFCSDGISGQRCVAVESTLPLQRAVQNPLTRETFFEAFGKVGNTSFIINDINDVDCSRVRGSLFLPVSELKKIRQRAIKQLEQPEYVKPEKVRDEPSAPPLPPARARLQKSSLAVLVSDLEDAAFFSPLIKTVLLELNSAKELRKAAGRLSAYPNIFPFFPAILFEKECGRIVEALDKTVCPTIVANNSGLGLAAGRKGIGWVAGPGLNCMNPYAVKALQEEGGSTGAFLSPELNARQIKSASAGISGESWLVVMGPLLMMTTRQCLLADSARCTKNEVDAQCLTFCEQYAVWYDEMDMPFYVYKRPGAYTQIFNNAILFIPEAVHLLRGRISRFVLDMRNFPFYQLTMDQKWKIMIYFTGIMTGEPGQDKDAIKEMLPKTTSGHFKRGI
ncbi:MAG: DUF3656 domain-containing protein, partial [bacterium]